MIRYCTHDGKRLVCHTPVVEEVDDFRGWALTDCIEYKPGVYRVGIERPTPRGWERFNAVAKKAVVTTAIETGVLVKREC